VSGKKVSLLGDKPIRVSFDLALTLGHRLRAGQRGRGDSGELIDRLHYELVRENEHGSAEKVFFVVGKGEGMSKGVTSTRQNERVAAENVKC